MADEFPSDFPADLVKMWKEIKKNLEAEAEDLASAPAKFTRKTGMVDPDLDIGPKSAAPAEKEKQKA